ncbi:MAG: chorismate-binding protein, partial [Oleibacter sp.]|nr:chorismate-binding protein [Thalassolituus sp.]
MFTFKFQLSAKEVLSAINHLSYCGLFRQHSVNSNTTHYVLVLSPLKILNGSLGKLANTVSSKKPTTEIFSKQIQNQEQNHLNEENSSVVKNWSEAENQTGFISGWVGNIDYPDSTDNDSMCFFGYHDASILLDLNKDECFLQSSSPLSAARTLELIDDLSVAINESTEQSNDYEQKKFHKSTRKNAYKRNWQAAWSYKEYQLAFDAVHNYLINGDCYQVNLAMPFICTDDLRSQNPLPLLEKFNAPHACYFKTAAFTLFSVSPEQFLQVNDKVITTKPIKGTAPRHDEPKKDNDSAEFLLSSHKNRAENIMIVDLLRNDLSMSAKPHSVSVPDLFKLESHKNVHHLVSTITAQLRDDLTAADAVITAFPGGSITGAPKRRAMEIIAELECQPRDSYCG